MAQSSSPHLVLMCIRRLCGQEKQLGEPSTSIVDQFQDYGSSARHLVQWKLWLILRACMRDVALLALVSVQSHSQRMGVVLVARILREGRGLWELAYDAVRLMSR